ncbi:MAG: pilus assembly protein PilM [Bdellovibrionales bacterium]|nr:pilus assembly protein PilM [Bdellovibrionales bacterium]
MGVDIGSCAVKAVAIKKTNKTFTVLQTHILPIKEDKREEQKKLLIVSHLKSLANLYRSPETKYIFCLSQNIVSTETLSFPFKERYKIRKSLPYQLEEKLSLFDNKNLISDIKTTHFIEGKQQVLVFSAFKDNISDLIKDINSIGITPYILTCEASAVANLFEITEDTQNKRENYDLYLKIGHTHTMALVFIQGRLRNVYSFGWGAAACIRKIAIKYEVPFQKAMQQFCEKAFVLTQTKGYTGSQIAFSKILQQAFDNLIDKLRLLLLQLEGEKNYRCKKVFLFGGGSQVRNLQTLLSTQLNVPVSRVEHPPHFPQWNLRNNNEQQNNLVTALGAAMEGLKKTKDPAINFLKEEFAVKINPFSFFAHRWKHPLVLGISAFIILLCYSVLHNHQSEKLSDKTHRLFKTKSIQIAKINPKELDIQRVQKFLLSRKKITKQAELAKQISLMPSALDTMKRLSVAINKKQSWKLEIQELNIIDDKIEIKGEIVASYLNLLEKNLTELAKTGSLKKLEDSSTNNLNNNKEPNIVSFKYSFIQKQG